MIKLDHVSKSYLLNGSLRVDALKDFSYSFPETGFFFLLGKSGSGKSTLLHVLGAMDGPTEGKVYFDGVSLDGIDDNSLSAIRSNMIGYVFQESNLLSEFDVGNNVRIGLTFSSGFGVDVGRALREVGLEGYEKRKIGELSGGQRQRVAIARALAKRPRVLICDEPTSALDTDTAASIFSLLKEISKSTLVICATHDEGSAYRYGDNVLRMESGRLLGDSKVDVDANSPHFEGDAYVIPNGYCLSEREKDSIAEYYSNPDTSSSKAFRAGCFLKEAEKDVEIQPSPLPKKKRLGFIDSLKMSFSVFAKKKLRLFFTIILNVMTLLLVGVSGSIVPFDARENSLQNLLAAPYGYLNFSLGTKDPVGLVPSIVGSLSVSDGETIGRQIGERCYPVVRKQIGIPNSFSTQIPPNLVNSLNGLCAYSEEIFKDFGFAISYGSSPVDSKDVLISYDAAKTFLAYPERDLYYPNCEAVVGVELREGYRVCGVFEHRIDLSMFGSIEGFMPSASDSNSKLGRLAYLRSEMNKQSPIFTGFVASLPNSSSQRTDYIAPFEAKAAKVAHEVYWGDEEPGIILNHISSTLGSFGNDLALGFRIGSIVVSVLMSGLTLAANYLLISFSVERKKREISVLRSMGASKGDVARIYLTESLVIGMFSAAASLVSSYFVISAINDAFLSLVALSIPVFPFGLVAILSVIVISLLAVTLSSVPNILKIASRAPYEGIASE